MSRPPFLVQPQSRSRHRFQVATSWRLTHVATSNWCHDTAQTTPGRDLQTGLQHRFSCPAPKSGRDFIFPGCDLLELHLCRDIVPNVVTSFLPIVGLLGRDYRNPCRYPPHCCPCRDLKMMSRQPNQLIPISATSRRHFPMS